MENAKFCAQCGFWYEGNAKEHAIKYHRKTVERANWEENFPLDEYLNS